MSEYEKIVASFRNLGHFESSVLQQYQINKAMNKLATSSGSPIQFDKNVAQQLWEHTVKERGNSIVLKDYIQSLMDAQNVLRQHIQTTQQKLKFETNPANIQLLQADLFSYVNDHNVLTQPFHLPNIPDSKNITESKAILAASTKVSEQPVEDVEFDWARASQFFATVPSEKEESQTLKIVLIMTSVLLCLQLFVMFHKNHFFNLMVYALIMLIFTQNFFDKLYMRITIISVALSIILDFIWVIVHSQNWWNPYPETQHSTIQTGYLRFSYFLVIITMLAKVFLLILMVRYFNNSENIKKSVTLYDVSFQLDGNSDNNPITHAITGSHHQNISEIPPIQNIQNILIQ